MKHIIIVTAIIAAASIFTTFATSSTASASCGSAGCAEPGKASGKWKSEAAKRRFQKECTWLPFPVGKVEQPIVFFTQESDSRCIGKQYRRPCQECTDWIHPDRPRGPVNGPAANAVVAVRLHDGLTGVSVPKDSLSRIVGDAAWCDFGRTDPHDSHAFTERPW